MLAIITAFEDEIRDYLSSGGLKLIERKGDLRFYRASEEAEIIVAVGAFGRERAEEATRHVIEDYECAMVVSAGFGGGARPGLNPGDIYVCDTVKAVEGPPVFWRAEDAEEIAVDDVTMMVLGQKMVDERSRFNYGKCLTLPQLISNGAMKQWIGDAFGVNVLDMESYWVCKVAAEHGKQYLVIRSVLDPMEQTLPIFISESLGYGRVATLIRAVRYVVAHPSAAPKLWRLMTQAKQARAALAEFLVGMTVLGDSQSVGLAVDAG
ncbi:MAG: hypothetical protein IIC83_04730 [Chloroflexi bacterium]|nr:hypothetical protein [Chloroflexota bacterium]